LLFLGLVNAICRLFLLCSEDTMKTVERTQRLPYHRWEKTSCELCRGEGRLSVIFKIFTENGTRKRVLERIQPYSQPNDVQPGQFATIFRCECPAGEAKGIPQSWPRWQS